MDKDYLKFDLEHVSKDILCDCSSRYGINKGYIVANDPDGKVLNFVKDCLDYNALCKAGKVREITIDNSWTNGITNPNTFDDVFWNSWENLFAESCRANHGLLVINIKTIDAFRLCWQLKQLAKQEREFEMIPPYSSVVEQLAEDYPNLVHHKNGELYKVALKYPKATGDYVKCGDSISFQYDGYVLMVIDDIEWKSMRAYGKANNPGEFEAMMCFYRLLTMF